MALVNAGVCKNVLIWRAMNERSQYRFGQPSTDMAGYTNGHGTGTLLWNIPFGAMTPASWGALQAQRYLWKYGLTNADLAHVCVQQRKYAAINPNAWFYQKPITVEDHQASKWIVEPVLRLLDCCQESDGGVAILVTSLDRARDLKQKPVRILGACQSIPYNVEVIANFHHDDMTVMPEAKGTAKRLYEMTGLGPQDMQAAMLYDAFSPHVLLQLEGFGFCKPGEAAAFVKSGGMAIDGALPVNTHGGLAGEAYIHGMNSMAEGVQKMLAVAERAKTTFIQDKSKVFNTARVEALELDNLIEVALSTMISANARQESRGAHDRSDFPNRDDVNWMKHTLAWLDEKSAKVKIDYRPVHTYTMSNDIQYIEPKARVY